MCPRNKILNLRFICYFVIVGRYYPWYSFSQGYTFTQIFNCIWLIESIQDSRLQFANLTKDIKVGTPDPLHNPRKVLRPGIYWVLSYGMNYNGLNSAGNYSRHMTRSSARLAIFEIIASTDMSRPIDCLRWIQSKCVVNSMWINCHCACMSLNAT